MAHPRRTSEGSLSTNQSRVRRALGASAIVMLLGAGSLHCSGTSDDNDDDHPPPFPGAGQVNAPIPDRPVGQTGPTPVDSDRGGTGGRSANDPFGNDDGGTSSAGRAGDGFVNSGGTNSGVGGGPLPFGGSPAFGSGGRTSNTGGGF